MSAKYISSNWRLLNQENSSKSDNYGLTFDGSNEYIDTGDAFTSLTSFSISAWFKSDDTVANAQAIVSSRINSISSSKGVDIYFTSNTLVARVYNNGATEVTTAFTDTSNWHQVVITYNGTTLELFLDNVSQGTATGVYTNSAANWLIGKWNRGANYFNGSISEVAIFDYALSSTQISTLYGSSELGSTSPMALKPQPVAYYPLGDNSASNPLTQPNEAVEDASVFDFDGISQYIDCGDNDAFSFGNGTTDSPFSISAWFNADVLSSANRFVISKFTTSTQREYLLELLSGSVSMALCDTSNSSNRITINHTTGVTFETGRWYHIAFTYDGSGTTEGADIYVDGVLASTATKTKSLGYVAMGNKTAPLKIGERSGKEFDGKISNVVLWNSDQSSEISNIYNSGVPATSYTNTPTAWYKLDQSANWEADSSGDWQIPDAVTAYPQSFNFNGLRGADGNPKQEIIATNVPQGQNFTFSCWANFNSPTANRYDPLIVVYSGSTSIIELVKMRSGTTNGSQVYFTVRNTSNDRVMVFSNVVPTANEWCHIAGTYDGSNVTIYFNGAAGQSLPQTGDTIASGPIEIGSWYAWNTTYGRNFDGQISNVQYFDTVLPATGTDSIETLYNNGVPLTTAIASDNLKGWWKLDNTATFSTNWSVPDASGNGNTGTSSGMTEQNLVNNNVSVLNGESSGMTSANLVLSDLTRAVPYDSYSFNFDGTESIDCGNPTEFQFTGDFSISGWFKTSSTASQRIISKDDVTNRSYYIQLIGNSYLRGAVFTSGTQQSNNFGSGLADGNWHHFVFTFENGVGTKLYIDNGTPNLDSFTSSLDNDPAGLIIGSRGDGANKFNGKISNISLFNKTLTSTEVLKLYSNGVPQDLTNFTPTPVAWWTLGSNSFFNGSNYICRDLIGSNDGTSANAGVDAIVGDAPRSSANGTGTNMDIPTNLEGSTKWSDNNSWSINMSETARVEDTP